LNDVLRNVGKLPATQNIDLEEIFAAFKFDKKQTGTSLQWILLEKIGKPKIVSGEDISDSAVRQTLKKVLQPPNWL
jgi:3-dehydroquinate synthetase